MNSPLVSIVVPVYNLEAYISECLESALCQDYARIEIVVVNDGSTDGSCELLRRYARLHRNLIYIETPNQGLSSARNLGLEAARGQYVLFLDGDDHLELDAVSRCVDVLERNCADIVLFSSSPFVDGSGKKLSLQAAGRDSRLVDKVMPAESFLLRSLQVGNYMPSACLYMFDKRLVETIRFLPGILHEDNLFTARLLLENGSARVVGISDALFNRRVRLNSITTMKKTHAHAEGFFQVAEHLRRVEVGQGGQGRKASSWLVQFALKEALSALQKATSAVSIDARVRALRSLFSVPLRYWKVRYLPFIVLPDLNAWRSMISSRKPARDVR
ncbi:glycosyltransferase family 2 protein [Lysobacter rhizosphaerae]